MFSASSGEGNGGVRSVASDDLRTMSGSGGGSSSNICYFSASGSSNSSSVENISTSSSIENGDQLTITFVPRKPPSSRCLSPLLEEVFSMENICFLTDDDRVSPVQKSFPRNSSSSSNASSSPAPPVWYKNGDINNGVSSLLKTVTNYDDCDSSASSYSPILQQLSGDGILLKSLEKGAAFPYLHLSTGSRCVSPPNFQEECRDAKQGVYKEIKRVVPPDSWIKIDSLHPEDQGKSTWLFLGFKTIGKNNETLEQSWKEWTGVRHLYLELRTDIHVRRISFFRRRDPHDCLDTFTYVAFMEIGAIAEKTHRWLLDFVQRARMDRMQSTVTVYEEIELWEADSGIPLE